MSVSLGYVPSQLTVHLVPAADFAATLRSSDGTDWPPGTVVALRLTPYGGGEPVVWVATVSGPAISWDVDAAAVTALGPPARFRADLTYTDAGVDVTWMQGTVVWHG